MIDGVRIDHGYWRLANGRDGFLTRRGKRLIKLPQKFQSLIIDKFFKHSRPVQFTVGYDPAFGIAAIAICHPSDMFTRKRGRMIVLNRIKQLRENGDNFDADKYPFVYRGLNYEEPNYTI